MLLLVVVEISCLLELGVASLDDFAEVGWHLGDFYLGAASSVEQDISALRSAELSGDLLGGNWSDEVVVELVPVVGEVGICWLFEFIRLLLNLLFTLFLLGFGLRLLLFLFLLLLLFLLIKSLQILLPAALSQNIPYIGKIMPTMSRPPMNHNTIQLILGVCIRDPISSHIEFQIEGQRSRDFDLVKPFQIEFEPPERDNQDVGEVDEPETQQRIGFGSAVVAGYPVPLHHLGRGDH